VGATVRVDAYPAGERVADAGRAVLGRESFDLRAEPGRDLVLVMRTAPKMEASALRLGATSIVDLDFTEAAMALRIDGQPAGERRGRPEAGWDEWVVRVPGTLVRNPRPRLEIAGRYASFYYWAFQ
jgi:hypothetical protein